jgi:acetyltransferase-like isoleucine patch superfamily enzyme
MLNLFNKIFNKNKKKVTKVTARTKFLNTVKNTKGNRILIPKNTIFKGEVNLAFNAEGAGYKFVVGSNCILHELKIIFKGKNNSLILGDNVRLRGSIIIAGENITLSIGENTTIQGASILAANANIMIGKNSMFSREIEIRSTDAHKIYDKNNKHINLPKEVIIGDRVWIGARAFISKGAIIPNGCIIGAMSFVSKSLEKENTIYAGVPVKEIKTDITWKR